MDTSEPDRPANHHPDRKNAGTNFGRWIERLCWLVTAGAAIVALMGLLDLLILTQLSAPQYAAMAAGVCAKVLVPYVFTRAVQGWRRA